MREWQAIQARWKAPVENERKEGDNMQKWANFLGRGGIEPPSDPFMSVIRDAIARCWQIAKESETRVDDVWVAILAWIFGVNLHKLED